MKKTTIILFITLFFSVVLFAQNKPGIEFNKTVYDYGDVKEEVEIAMSEFEFTNVGNTPVVIQRVTASCGCTAPTYTREPVLPGKKGNVKVAYHTLYRPGNFRKNVRVYTNVPDTVYTLTIKGSVIPKKR